MDYYQLVLMNMQSNATRRERAGERWQSSGIESQRHLTPGSLCILIEALHDDIKYIHSFAQAFKKRIPVPVIKELPGWRW